MSMIYAVAGFAVGIFVGIGLTLFYLKWKMGRQLGMMQEQMEDMMDMTGGMEDALGDMDDIEVEAEEIEEARKGEKDEEDR